MYYIYVYNIHIYLPCFTLWNRYSVAVYSYSMFLYEDEIKTLLGTLFALYKSCHN